MNKIHILWLLIFFGCYDHTPDNQQITMAEDINNEVDLFMLPTEETPISNNFEKSSLEEHTKIETIDILGIVNSNYKEIKDVYFWNDDIQTGLYRYFLENNNIDAVIEFRDFMEELDKEMAEAYIASGNTFATNALATFSFGGEYVRPTLLNPIIVIIKFFYNYTNDHYMRMDNEALATIYNERPHLFYQGNRSRGEHSGSLYYHPLFVEAVIVRNMKAIEFFVENIPDWSNIMNRLHSDWNTWTEYPIGGNVLVFLSPRNTEIYNYLLEQGIPEYIDITNESIMVAPYIDSINVWSEPSFNSEIICRINSEEAIKPIKLTARRGDGEYQWVHFEMDNETKGWAPFMHSIYYDSGI